MLAIADDLGAGDAAGADPGAQALVLAEDVEAEGASLPRMVWKGSPAPAPAAPAPSTAFVAAEPPSAEILRARVDALRSSSNGNAMRKRTSGACFAKSPENEAEHWRPGPESG